MTRTVHRRLLAVFALAVLAPAGLVACGDDDDNDAATATTAAENTSGDLDAYCEATVDIETIPEPDIDFDALSEEELAAEVKKFATGSMRPIVDRIVAAAPADLADDIQVLDNAVKKIETDGDFEVFDSPEVEAVSDRVHAFDLKNCGWAEQDVKAVNYAFEGVPASLDAGVTSFEFTNAGTEQHEMVVLRKKADTTESFDELLALPEEEGEAKTTFVAATGAGPNDSEYSVIELEAGEYAMVCFIAVGTINEDDEVEGPPHFTKGMVHEFSVS